MSDIAQLRSQIAVFAQTAAPAQPQPAGGFFDKLTLDTFDAVHMKDGHILATFGQADDLTTLARNATKENPVEATVFVCSSDHDPDQILFCGAYRGMVIVLRSRAIPIDTLISIWRQQFG